MSADRLALECSTPITRPRDLLPPAVVDALCRVYPIGDWYAWQRTPQGHDNVSFYIRASSGTYVLRRSNCRKSRAGLQFELCLIDYLARRGYPVPEIIRTRHGAGFVELDGSLYLLSAQIRGRPYDSTDPRQLAAAGRALGLYHRLVTTFPGPRYRRSFHAAGAGDGVPNLESLHVVAQLTAKMLDPATRRRLCTDLAYLRRQFVVAQPQLVAALPGLSRLIIQGSFGRSALLFDGERLVGVVDFDRAGFGLRAIDFEHSLRSLGRFTDRSRADYRSGFDCTRCRTLLSAYREVEPLASAELEALPLVLKVQGVGKVADKCVKLLTKHHSGPRWQRKVEKLAGRVAREADRLRWLDSHADELNSALLS